MSQNSEQSLQSIICDVLVVGAGTAGISAAISAAETGAQTILLEAGSRLGGTLAGQILEHAAGFHDSQGRTIVRGVGQRIIDSLVEYGSSPGHVPDDMNYMGSRTPINHAELTLIEAQYLQNAGVQLTLQSPMRQVIKENGYITEVLATGPAGDFSISPKVVVDCSGDAVAAYLAGADLQTDVAKAQPATIMLRMAGVDFAHVKEYVGQNQSDFLEGSNVSSWDWEHMNFWGFGKILQEGFQQGVLSLERSEIHVACWPSRGECVINFSRVPLESLDGLQLGSAYLGLQQQILEFVHWFRRLFPGGKSAYLAETGDRVGIRDSRRILGHYTIDEQHLLSAATSEESVAVGGFPIDIHEAGSQGMESSQVLDAPYDIPFGALLSKDVKNLLAAGRCLSATRVAQGSTRITGTCFATGEAAGVAAALATASLDRRDAVQSYSDISQLPVAQVRAELLRRGAIVSSKEITETEL